PSMVAVGLARLISLLGAPLVAAFRVRRSSVVPITSGAYLAFLLHAAIDWDWQLPTVTLSALACGCVLFLAARGVTGPRILPMNIRLPVAAIALVLFGAALVGLRGNLAIAASNHAADARNWTKSAREAR